MWSSCALSEPSSPLAFKSRSILAQPRNPNRTSDGGGKRSGGYPFITLSSSPPPPPPHLTATGDTTTTGIPTSSTSPVLKKRNRYRKAYPGESKGIVEEMRFVAMRLRKGDGGEEEDGGEVEDAGAAQGGETWQPSREGFLKYLVDSKLVFDTLERTVDRSEDVAYAYFRKTGLERSYHLSKDLDYFTQQGIVIPQPSSPGTAYAAYLKELAENSAPSFLCHFYNVYFAHVTGGQAIGKQVSEKLLEGRELEFYKWDEDVLELMKDVREKLNKLGEHWTRDEKNRCLRETTKCYRFSGQIVRLIIL